MIHIVLGWRHIFWIIFGFWLGFLLLIRSKDSSLPWTIVSLVLISISMASAVNLLLGG